MIQILKEKTSWFYVSDRFFLSLSPEVKCLLPRLGTAPNFIEVTDVDWTTESEGSEQKQVQRSQSRFIGEDNFSARYLKTN